MSETTQHKQKSPVKRLLYYLLIVISAVITTVLGTALSYLYVTSTKVGDATICCDRIETTTLKRGFPLSYVTQVESRGGIAGGTRTNITLHEEELKLDLVVYFTVALIGVLAASVIKRSKR